jgi:hypothetical protein
MHETHRSSKDLVFVTPRPTYFRRHAFPEHSTGLVNEHRKTGEIDKLQKKLDCKCI